MSGWYLGWRQRLPGGFMIGWRRRLFSTRRRGFGVGCGGFLLLACCAAACLAALPRSSSPAPTATVQHAAAATLPATSTHLSLSPTAAQASATLKPSATTAPTQAASATLKPAQAATHAPVAQLTATTAPVVQVTATTQAIAATNTQAPPAGGGFVCPNGTACIKGNISSDGRKFYHLPNCPSYNSTKIDISKGERYFTSETEALAAGWVKAGNCS
jgi:hypothetical protein